MALGAYAGDHAFPAAEASIRTLRISAITISDSAVYADTSKNEDTWCEVLGDFVSRVRYNPESIRRVVV